MRLSDNREQLPKPIDIRLRNRPLSVSFIVSTEESQENHWALDAIFCDSYRRWGGGKSLIVPYNNESGIDEQFLRWLAFLDSDFVYTYKDLGEEEVSEICHRSMPIEVIRHNHFQAPSRMQSFLPEWPSDFSPVSSASALTTPLANYVLSPHSGQSNQYLTQLAPPDESRFIPDNFGTQLDHGHLTKGRKGVFETICFCREDTPGNMIVGDNRCHSLSNVIKDIATGKTKPISRLAHIYTEGIKHPHDYHLSETFFLQIGNTVEDRIDFWNRRVFQPEHRESNGMILDPTLLTDEEFLAGLGEYLNRVGYASSNGPNHIEIVSRSLNHDQCATYRDAISPHTWNAVSVSANYSNATLPRRIDQRSSISGTSEPQYSFSTDSRSCTNRCEEPYHFKFIPSHFLSSKRGNWAIELDIERHVDDCQISNVVNDWKLPRRYDLIRAFSKNPGKINCRNNLSLLTKSLGQTHFSDQLPGNVIELTFPDDEQVFRHLVCGIHGYPRTGPMAFLNSRRPYYDLSISDKGQHHRGVIALFDHSVFEAAILTNQFWRQLVRSSTTANPRTYSRDNLTGIVNNTNPAEIANITSAMRFGGDKKTRKYLRESLLDTVEYLVSRNVLHQLYSWRCSLCGYRNERNLDAIKQYNPCSVCGDVHFVGIDIEWQYSVSPFLVEALCTYEGMTVLWGIYSLLDRSRLRQQLYLPEVNLFDKENLRNPANEIDLLCIVDGKFVAAEVKRTATQFLNQEDEIVKFIAVIGRLIPDEAFLVFERIDTDPTRITESRNALDQVVERIRASAPSKCRVSVVVAEDSQEFVDFPKDLGYYGKRTMQLLFEE